MACLARLGRALEVVKIIDSLPALRHSVETLAELAKEPDNIEEVMCLVESLLSKSQENLQWSLDERVMKPLLFLGLDAASDNHPSCHGWVVSGIFGDDIFFLSKYSECGGGEGKETAILQAVLTGPNALLITDLIFGSPVEIEH